MRLPSFLREHPENRGGAESGADGPKVRIRFRFVGTVQAVGFRWTTMSLARAIGATGWVRNELDGSVTAEIQGTPAVVEQVVDGLDQQYNGSAWTGGFQIAARQYLPVVNGELTFKVTYV